MPPQLYVIAGPNGIGKTTSAYDMVPANTPIINSDEIAAAVKNAGIVTANAQEYGNREAAKMIDDYMSQRSSFAMETNLADTETWKFLAGIQKTGYEVNLLYLSCDDLSLLNSRIEQRALAGEHFIRPDIVAERYINGLKLLEHYFTVPDTLQLFDNSESPQQMAEVHKGTVVMLADKLPNWVTAHFAQALGLAEKKVAQNLGELKSVGDVRKAYEALQQKNTPKKKGPRL